MKFLVSFVLFGFAIALVAIQFSWAASENILAIVELFDFFIQGEEVDGASAFLNIGWALSFGCVFSSAIWSLISRGKRS